MATTAKLPSLNVVYRPQAAVAQTTGIHPLLELSLESKVEALSRKLAGRKLCDRAEGLLQTSFQWTEVEACLHIRHTSRRRRAPMRDIAHEILELARGIQ